MTKLASLLALLPVALAFKDTVPLVAWSTHLSPVIDRLTKVTHAHLFDNIISEDNDICSHGAVIIIDQPGVHASDLRVLPPSSHIARSLEISPSSHQRSYVPTNSVGRSGDLVALAEAIAERCRSQFITFSPEVSMDKNEKSVVILNLPPLSSEGYSRKDSMLYHDQLVADAMSSLPFESQLIFYSSSLPSHHKRQLDHEPPALEIAAAKASQKGGILARYQLLTPGLIITLLIGLFILLPILYFGISALASIQSPVRMDAPKGFNALEKKRQ